MLPPAEILLHFLTQLLAQVAVKFNLNCVNKEVQYLSKNGKFWCNYENEPQKLTLIYEYRFLYNLLRPSQ
jgi:hypothetical protein